MASANTKNKILKVVLKDITARHSITSLSKCVSISRQGLFKVIKKLESEKLLILSPLGTGKTSAYEITLNWENSLLEKILALALAEDAAKNQRWVNNFSALEKHTQFSIIYGSILNKPKEAADVDIVNVVQKKSSFLEIGKVTHIVQKTKSKKIHSLNFTEVEFRNELKKMNPAFIDAVKKGIVLFGQENFIKFIRRLKE